jgi:branched-subunit amino acid aminotransferase/4-amino-4-deoxychorismate lyase
MSVLGDFYRLESGELKPVIDSSLEVQLKVADSWLVDEGRVRSLRAHFDRFGSWVLNEDPKQQEYLAGYFAEVRRLLPRIGRWFPRMEYHAEQTTNQRLYLRLREAPARIDSVSLWTYPEPDPRHYPQVKGPDLSLCQQIRRHANMNGADEAVITDSKGFVAEGALSALVWWRGDVLCSSDDHTNWLPSITRHEVFSIADQMGFETRVEKVKPAELAKLPIWALSSLNGIMPVSSWVGVSGELPESVNLDAFSKRLKLLGTQLD